MAKYDGCRVDYLAQAEELAHFAQPVELDTRSAASFGRNVVTQVTEGKLRVDPRTYYGCGQVGHIQLVCPNERTKKTKNNGKKGAWRSNARINDVVNFMLSVQEAKNDEDLWILDSGSSKHFINNKKFFENARECDQCLVADGNTLRLKMVGSVLLCVMACERGDIIRLIEAYYVPALTRNIMSSGKLELKGYELKYENEQRALVSLDSGAVVLDV